MTGKLDQNQVKQTLKQFIAEKDFSQALAFLTELDAEYPQTVFIAFYQIEIFKLAGQLDAAISLIADTLAWCPAENYFELFKHYHQLAVALKNNEHLQLSSLGLLACFCQETIAYSKLKQLNQQARLNLLIDKLNHAFKSISSNKFLHLFLPLFDNHLQQVEFTKALQVYVVNMIEHFQSNFDKPALKAVMKLYSLSLRGFGGYREFYLETPALIDEIENNKAPIAAAYINYIDAWAKHHDIIEKPVLKHKEKYRLAYLLSYCQPETLNSLYTAVILRLRGHLENASGQFEYHLYLLGDINPELQALQARYQANLRIHELAPLSLLARYQKIRADDIDILVADHFMEQQTALFQLQAAPVQIQGVARWSDSALPNLDYITTGSFDSIAEVSAQWPNFERFKKLKLLRVLHYISATIYDENQAVLPEVVQQERNKFPQDHLLIGTYARLEKISEQYLVLLNKILNQFDKVYVLLAGVGQSNHIEAFIKNSPHKDRIQFLNQIVSGKIYAGVFDVILNTFPHAAGVALFEFFYKGTPVIHTQDAKVPSLHESRYVPELICHNDDDALALLTHFVEEPEFLQAMRQRSRAAFDKICEDSTASIKALEQTLYNDLYVARM